MTQVKPLLVLSHEHHSQPRSTTHSPVERLVVVRLCVLSLHNLLCQRAVHGGVVWFQYAIEVWPRWLFWFQDAVDMGSGPWRQDHSVRLFVTLSDVVDVMSLGIGYAGTRVVRNVYCCQR